MTESQSNTQSNVITFPPRGRYTQLEMIPTPAEVKVNVAASRDEEIDELSGAVAMMIVQQLSAAGFPPLSTPAHMKNLAFVFEAARALVASYYDKPHAFHQLAQACFEFDPDDHEQLNFLPPVFKLFEVDPTQWDEDDPNSVISALIDSIESQQPKED